MPIYERGSTYQVSVSHKGKRYRKTCQTLPDAHQWEADAKAILARGGVPEDIADTAAHTNSMSMADILKYTTEHAWKNKSYTLIRNGITVTNALGPKVIPPFLAAAKSRELSDHGQLLLRRHSAQCHVRPFVIV